MIQTLFGKNLRFYQYLECLITDDANRLAQGLGTQHYDAMLLYADEDTDFATEMRKKLEDEFGLKARGI